MNDQMPDVSLRKADARATQFPPIDHTKIPKNKPTIPTI